MYTSGALILTNDGEFIYRVTHPKYEIEKTYNVTVKGIVTKEEIKQLSKGVDIGDYITKPCSVELIETNEKQSKLRITITEGKNRQIRKMFAAINKEVTFLKRVQIGDIKLGGLSRGEYAPLNQKELRYLKSLKK